MDTITNTLTLWQGRDQMFALVFLAYMLIFDTTPWTVGQLFLKQIKQHYEKKDIKKLYVAAMLAILLNDSHRNAMSPWPHGTIGTS